MKRIILVTIGMLMLTSCASNRLGYVEAKLNCVDRLLAQGVEAIKSKDVCAWAHERK